MPRVPLAKIHACLIVVRDARERIETEGAERHRKDERVARPAFQMRDRPLQRLARLALDRQRHDIDVRFLAIRTGVDHERARMCGLLARGLRLGVREMKTRPRRKG